MNDDQIVSQNTIWHSNNLVKYWWNTLRLGIPNTVVLTLLSFNVIVVFYLACYTTIVFSSYGRFQQGYVLIFSSFPKHCHYSFQLYCRFLRLCSRVVVFKPLLFSKVILVCTFLFCRFVFFVILWLLFFEALLLNAIVIFKYVIF